MKPKIRVQGQSLYRAVKWVATESMSHSKLMLLIYVQFYKKEKVWIFKEFYSEY